MRYRSLLTAIALLLPFNASAQQTTTATSSVANVQVTASAKDAEVGQQLKLTVVATDASGKVVNEQPSTYFAGPFDIAAVDDDRAQAGIGLGDVLWADADNDALARIAGQALVFRPALCRHLQ